ncbi:MAG: tetratricopeptide repeat protein, partial [Proteobacteria bacterium]|nr:tetratricopeptide repeat protein [Pseudomonadota bacterium]
LATGPLLESPALRGLLGVGGGAAVAAHGLCAGVLLLAGALHLVRVCLAWLEGRSPLGLLARAEDPAALLRSLAWSLRIRPAMPALGRFSYRERVPYTFFLAAVPLLGMSGWAVSHPIPASRALGAAGLLTAAGFHSALGLAAVPFLLWHVYFSHLQPGVLFWNAAWLTGQSSWSRVAALRPGWARELAAEVAPGEGQTEEAPSVESLLEEGNRAARETRYADAEGAFQEALRLYPGYPQALFNLGVVRSKAGDRAGARDALERYLEADSFGPVAGRARELLERLRRESGGG